jgi:hypothetical protein
MPGLTWTLQGVGLDAPALTTALGVLALLTFLWGVHRYRSSYSKAEFALATLLSLGIFLLALVPDLFNLLGAVLQIRKRPLVVALVSNVVLAALMLYTLGRTRDQSLALADLTRSLALSQASIDRYDADRTVAVVVPAYNEAANVGEVVDSLPASVCGHAVEPLVVSDGSSDETAARARAAGAAVVEHSVNQGQGGALKTGFEIARRNGADIVVTVDADGQHPVDQLDELVAPIAEDRADYVVGSRYLGTDRSNNGPVRTAGIYMFTAVLNLVAGTGITDCTNGFRAIRASRLEELTIVEERFNAPEMLIEARKNGLSIVEIPVTIAQRQAGETKKPQLGYAIGLARTIVTTLIR